MNERFQREIMLIGEEGLSRLKEARIAVFGLGGVGGHAAEALARAGVGHFLLVDKDAVEISNLNRQAVAFQSTLGRLKTEVMKERILDIDPEAEVEVRNVFFLPENAGDFRFSDYDYVVDCVDTVTAKLSLIESADAAGVPIISAMGAGNRLDPARMRVADIYETEGDPLSRVMRRELRKRGIRKLKVVYSGEKPVDTGVRTPGSISFVPAVMGLIMAGEVVRGLAGITGRKEQS